MFSKDVDSILRDVYYLSTDKTVAKAKVDGVSLTENGYLIVYLKTYKGNKISTEICHVHDTKEEAEEWGKFAVPIHEQAEDKVKTAQAEVNALRELIIGKPRK